MIACTMNPGEETKKIVATLSDKVVHGIIIGILSVFYIYEKGISKEKSNIALLKIYLKSFILAAIAGGIIEIVQSFIPYRSCDIYDWLADLAGSLLFIFATELYRLSFLKPGQLKKKDAHHG